MMRDHLLTRPRRLGTTVGVVIAALVQATNVCAAQDTTGRATRGHGETREATHTDTASPMRPGGGGPAFFAVRAQDGARVDARGAPELNRRVSVSFIDATLGAAVQSVAADAGLEVTYSTELIPPGARVTMSADDVTVATALSRVLTNARVDILVGRDGHLTLVAQTGPAAGGDAGARALVAGMPSVRALHTADTARAARLAGRVVQPDGTPVSGAAVGLVGTPDTATTDGAGHFTIRAAQSGPYLVSVRRLGFQPARIAVSLSSRDEREVSVTLVRTVALLPTVTTTAAERAAYRAVGFAQRMQAGNGYFLTYDQIVRKQATQFSDLLQSVPGLKVTRPARQFGAAIKQSRGGPTCVSYVIDGNPQPMLIEHSAGGAALGPESPDHLFEVADMGAIEVYQASERPVRFGSDWCALVVIWTRTRLGLTPVNGTVDDNAPRSSSPVIHGTPAIVADAQCALPASSDTMDFPIFATLHTDAPRVLSRKTWARYTDSVLGVIEQWSVVPTDLALSTFGLPFVKDPDGSGDEPLEVSPALSTVSQVHAGFGWHAHASAGCRVRPEWRCRYEPPRTAHSSGQRARLPLHPARSGLAIVGGLRSPRLSHRASGGYPQRGSWPTRGPRVAAVAESHAGIRRLYDAVWPERGIAHRLGIRGDGRRSRRATRRVERPSADAIRRPTRRCSG